VDTIKLVARRRASVVWWSWRRSPLNRWYQGMEGTIGEVRADNS
jgi:hypothetical protein